MSRMSCRGGALLSVSTALAVVAWTAGCGSGEPGASEAASGSTSSGPSVTLEGMFDAGGHKLYLRCRGEGGPTVVYLHGYSVDAETESANADSGIAVEQAMPHSLRYCAYDRRNVARSDEVDGVGTGVDAVADLHALMASAEIAPPYLLLGASWGGMVAYQYAATHPDEVVGMVLLDANFPGELALEQLWPEEDRLTHEEFFEEDEKFDQLAAYEEAAGLPVPAVPVTYLLAMPFGWEQGLPEYDAAIRPAIEQYVAGFAPGRLEEVESPHWMENSVPQKIVDEVTAMAETAGG
jgi:pimeloyl-ACP methyl ester carboxylesterase